MDLRRWTHIVAVADRRSFVRAAEQVHLSQPALTRSIQAAEAELGMVLFDRGSQEVVPTPAGEFVVERARQLVFNSRNLERDIELYRSRKLGDTAFGVGPFPAATFLTELLSGLRREFPAINLRVEISNGLLLLKRLMEEDIEFFAADTSDLPIDPAFEIRPLRREPGGFFVRAGHPLAARRSVALAQLWEFGLLSVQLPSRVYAALAQQEPTSSPPKLAVECDDIDVLRGVVRDCDSVLVAPRAAVRAEIEAGELVELPGLPKDTSQTGIVTLRGRTPSPMASLIIDRLPLLVESHSSRAG